MSVRARIEFDRGARIKLKKVAITGRIKSEDTELALDVRESRLFARCGHDMAIYTSLLKRLDGLVKDDLIEAAYADALEDARPFPLTPPEPKIEDLRLELLHEPDAALASLLEQDGFTCHSSRPSGPFLYYGRGVLNAYRPHLRSPEAVSCSPFAGAVVHAQTSGADKPSVPAAQARDEEPPASPAQPVTPPAKEEGAQVRTAAEPLGFRIDKLLGKPKFADRLVALVAEHGPLDKMAVIDRLKAAACQSRLRKETQKNIGDELDALVKAEALQIDEAGRYRSPGPAAASDASGNLDMTQSLGSASGESGMAEAGSPPPDETPTEARPSEVDSSGQPDPQSGTLEPGPDGHSVRADGAVPQSPGSVERPVGSRNRPPDGAQAADAALAELLRLGILVDQDR